MGSCPAVSPSPSSSPPAWVPPGVDPVRWRLALAEDVLDVLALLIEVDAAVAVPAADAALLTQIGWPGLRGYALGALDVVTVFGRRGGRLRAGGPARRRRTRPARAHDRQVAPSAHQQAGRGRAGPRRSGHCSAWRRRCPRPIGCPRWASTS